MRYALFVLIYIFLLLLHLPTGIITVDSVPVSAYFCQEVDCVTILISLLEQDANATCVFYDLDEARVVSYLQNTSHRVYTDKRTLDNDLRQRLIPLVRPGLMHHKFCITETTVLTGSWNPTTRGTYLNDNYILLLTNPLIVKAYEDELKRLTQNKRTQPTTLFDGTQELIVLFCPVHECERHVLDELRTAKQSIQLLSFTFTSKPLGMLLLEKQQEGLRVQIIQEQRQAHLNPFSTEFEKRKMVQYDGNSYTMHGKVWIIDNRTLILGSYNPTQAATTKNDENIVIIKNNTALVESFQEEFRRILLQSKE